MNRSPEDLIAWMFYWPVCWYWRWRYGKSLTSGGTMRKTSLDPIFLQAVLMMVVIVLLTVWIR